MTCSICLDDILDNTSVVILKCSHKYHFNCFYKYIDSIDDYNSEDESFEETINKYISCPYCRTKIDDIEPIVFDKDTLDDSSDTLTLSEESEDLYEFINSNYANLFNNSGITEIIGDTFICLNYIDKYRIIYYDEIEDKYISEIYPYIIDINEEPSNNLINVLNNIIHYNNHQIDHYTGEGIPPYYD